MSLDIDSVLNGVVSHALASGWLDRVNTVEPKNAPGHGLTAAIWSQEINPVPDASGLDSTTSDLIFIERLYSNMIQEPQDMIDPNLIRVTDALMAAYSADFTLGGTIRNVDLLGAYGPALRAQAGYITIGGTMFRCMDITLPLIVNDLWTQAA